MAPRDFNPPRVIQADAPISANISRAYAGYSQELMAHKLPTANPNAATVAQGQRPRNDDPTRPLISEKPNANASNANGMVIMWA